MPRVARLLLDRYSERKDRGEPVATHVEKAGLTTG
jgi:arsenic resistance protein ArsH